MKETDIRKNIKKILIVKPSSLGDIVHSLPFLYSIRNRFPDAEIHWLVAKGLEGLLQGHPMISRLHVINKDGWKNIKNMTATFSEIKNLSKNIRSENYDIAIDLQGLLRSGIISYASHAPVRIGFKEAREGSAIFYTNKIEGGREIHAVDRYLKIAAALGCETSDVKFPMPPFEETAQTGRIKNETGKYAVIVPGARWETKIWPYEKFGRLASMLPMKSIVIGSSADIGISEEIERLSKGAAVSLVGKTDLKELTSLIKDAALVVTNDSGPMHIAAAFDIPLIAIFGPTNPVRTGPYGKRHIIVKAGADCAPCYKKKCGNIKCMDNITVEQVYKAVKDILKEAE
jgi:lipopolysaccharide heptosyltransferase I